MDRERQSTSRIFTADVKLMRFTEVGKLHPSMWRLMLFFKPSLVSRSYFFSSVRVSFEPAAQPEELLKVLFEPYTPVVMSLTDYYGLAGIHRWMEIYGSAHEKGFSAEMKDLALLGGCPQGVMACSVRFDSFTDASFDILKWIDVLYRQRRGELVERERSFLIEVDRPQASFLLL
jgi:hypothetical protein